MNSIVRFLVRRLIVTLVCVWLAGSVVLFFAIRNQLKAQLDARMAVQAEAIASLVEVTPDGSLTMDFIDDFMPEFRRGGRNRFQVWNADGSTLFRSASLTGMDLPVAPTLGGSIAWRNQALPDGSPGRICWLRFIPRAKHEEIGTVHPEVRDSLGRFGVDDRPQVTVALLVPIREHLEFLRIFALMVALVLLVMCAVVVALVRCTVRIGLDPLHQLASRAREISTFDSAMVFPAIEVEELKDIVARLNELLARLRVSFDHEQRFSANVAHDLKTPIAELRTVAEVALHTARGDPVACANALEQCLAISREMDHLVTSLLELLHSQRHQEGTEFSMIEPVRVVEVVRECIVALGTDGNRHRWQIDADPDPIAQTSRVALANIIRQLVRNAADYAPPDSVVSVSVDQNGPSAPVVLSMSNQAPGTSEMNVEHMFDPFWRDSAHRGDRTRHGLGLSIARATADAIGGSLRAQFDNGSLTFVLSLPARGALTRTDGDGTRTRR